jgi:hypothetical protein
VALTISTGLACLAKLPVKTTLQYLFSSRARGPHAAVRATLADIQNSLRQALIDCSDSCSRRLLYRIGLAKVPADLWALRGDMYQCIAQTHTESTAVQRINELVKLFEGWVSDRHLAKI